MDTRRSWGIALILLVAFRLCAAGEGETQQTAIESGSKASEATENGAVRRLEITTFNYFGPWDGSYDEKLDRIWRGFMRERFGVDITVRVLPRPEYMANVGLGVSSGEIKGFVVLFGGAYMVDYYRDGATLALDEYLAENETWSSLDEGMRNTHMRDGKLLAIPSGYWGGLGFLRTIRTDWLENLGLEKPETVDELYEVIRAFTEDDPDGNGIDDTVGMTAAGVWNIQDIFMAFGVPTNHIGAHCITPDPHDGFRYNDGMLKPGMTAALAWLRRAYDNGYLDPEVFSNQGSDMRERMCSGDYGSTYYWASRGGKGDWFERQTRRVVPTARYDVLLGLTSGYAQEHVTPQDIRSSSGPKALVAGSKHPKEQANTFVDVFFGDEVGFFSGWLGPQGTAWKYGDNPEGYVAEIVRIPTRYDENGTPGYGPCPAMVSPMLEYNWLRYKLTYESWTEERNREYREEINKYWELVEEGFERGLFYRYPHEWTEPISETYNTIHADIDRIFDERVAQAVTGLVSVEEAIESYRREVGRLGGQRVLDEANEAIKKTSSAEYRY